jgi:lysophospholipase L1-like esterase
LFLGTPTWWEPEPGTFEPVAGFVGFFQEALPQNLPPSARFTPRVLELRTNSMGLRGPELTDKAPGERRILFGGDSLTFGHAVAEDESFPALTGRLLRQAGKQVSVANAGVPGYGFVATCKRLRRLRERTAADVLVAAYFLGNDFVDDIRQRTCTVVGGRMFDGPFGNLLLHSWRGRLCVRSRLALFVETWLLRHEPAWSVLPWFHLAPDQAAMYEALPQPDAVGGLFLDAPVDHVFHPGREPVVALWLRELEATLRMLQRDTNGTPLLIVILPTQFHIDAGLRGRVLQEAGFDQSLLQIGSAQRRITELCARLGLPCVDTTPYLAAGGEPAAVYNPDHLHFSVHGNEVVARVLAERLAPLLN